MKKLSLILLSVLLTGCGKYQYVEDNLLEEAVELGIKSYTGAELDLSPSELEKGFSPRSISPVKKKPL